MSGRDTTVSTGDIARLGGVGRAAVSNWRRRHDDFPAPVAGTTSSPRFSLADVESWMRRNGRSYRVSAADRAWQQLRPGGDDLLVEARLAAAGEFLLDPASAAADPELRRTLTELADDLGPAAAFEELCARHRPRAGLPDVVATAMTRIALPTAGTLLDPACGTGALLLAAAPQLALGQDGEPDAARIAAARLLLAGIDATVLAGDALGADGFATSEVDAVVCDPPAGDRTRGHAHLAGDPRFVHGLPPRTEPELAWVQHGLARVRPGGLVVLRMPAAAAARRAGRRIRANLLRAGALRAVITVPDGDLWVLRRPAAGEPAPSTMLLGRCPAEHAAPLWEAFVAGHALPEGGRGVHVADLLDDDVDVGPDRRLSRVGDPDPRGAFTALRDADPAGATPVAPLRTRRALTTTTVAELARSGAVRVRYAPARMVLGEGPLEVLTVDDLATGTTPSGRVVAATALVRVRPGDVVAAAMGRARVASTRAVLGPGLTAYRVDPARLDAEFLAGVLRAAPAPPGTGSTRYGKRVRVPVLSPAEQRAYGAAFRGLLDAADAARAAAERAEAMARLGGEGLVEGWLAPG